MPLNTRKKLLPGGNKILINYDFTDMLASVGYVNLYGICDEATVYKLTRLPLVSTTYIKNYAPSVSGLQGEVNFDYTFLTSQLVKGELFLSLTYYARAIATQSADCYLKIRILHYDGSTETVIGTQQTTDTITQTDDSAYLWKRTTLTFAVNKQFKNGDILRVEIETWSTTTTNAGAGFLMDGANRNFGQVDPAGTAVDSTIIIDVPFDLGGKL